MIVYENENQIMRKMRENYKYYGGLSLVYGLIFTFCLYKNMSGITFPICVIATIIFAVQFMKKIDYKLRKQSYPYIVGMILLGISTALTSSFFIHFFNLAGIVLLFFVFMIHQFYNDSAWNFPAYMKRIIILFGTIIQCIPWPYWHGAGYLNQNKEEKNNSTIFAVIIGFVAAIGALCVILPLLLKSDAVFSQLFGEVLRYINFGTILGVSLTFILGFTLCYAFFAALCKNNLLGKNPGRGIKYYHPVIGITFTSIVSVIYLIYCVIQIMYLFIRIQSGLPDNMTYAQYARGGFWELLFVSIINFVIVLLCMYLFPENTILKIVLTIISGCTFIMIFSAAYRMFLYIGVYHLTFLRIFVLWFLIVLTLIMSGVIVNIYKKQFPLFRYIVAVVGILYIGFSFSRPDTIITKYNIAHSENMEEQDIYYLLYHTSWDAAPEIAKINLDDYDWDTEWIEEDINSYFRYISEENEGIYFRKANYSRIRAKIAADEYLEKGTAHF